MLLESSKIAINNEAPNIISKLDFYETNPKINKK